MDEETREMIDLFKDKDVKLDNLLMKVYDLDTGKEGWISIDQIIQNFQDSLSDIKEKEQ